MRLVTLFLSSIFAFGQQVDYNTQVKNKPVTAQTSVQSPFAYEWAGSKYQPSILRQGETFPVSAMGPGIQDTFAATNVVPYGAAAGYVGDYPNSHSAAISGYAMTKDNRMGVVGIFGAGYCFASSLISTHASCWGGNFAGRTYTGSSGGESIFGAEFDIDIATKQPLNAAAMFCGGGSTFEPTNQAACMWVHQMGPEPVSTVNTSGTTVTWVSGSLFDPQWPAGRIVFINGSQYAVSSVTNTNSLVLSTSAGTQVATTLRLGTIVPYNHAVYSPAGAARYALTAGTLYSDSPQFTSSQSQYTRHQYRVTGTTKEVLQYVASTGEHVIQHDATASDPKTSIKAGALEVENRHVRFPSYTWAARPSPATPSGSLFYASNGGCGTTIKSLVLSDGSGYNCLATTLDDGRNIFTVPATAPNDATIPNSACSMWLNGTTLTWRCKKSDGTTYDKGL